MSRAWAILFSRHPYDELHFPSKFEVEASASNFNCLVEFPVLTLENGLHLAVADVVNLPVAAHFADGGHLSVGVHLSMSTFLVLRRQFSRKNCKNLIMSIELQEICRRRFEQQQKIQSYQIILLRQESSKGLSADKIMIYIVGSANDSL